MLECDVKVDGGTRGGMAQGLPAMRYAIPGVLGSHVIPRWCERRCEVGQRRGRKDGENKEPVAAHDGHWG